ncbi:hypothetical protein ACPPVO_03860 [Dactylosporangium sp. McL0621]|uniref:hypothetical protein n=1 Tax=Dactylosporangium sp. McL0621 TaxID=3415678 RepID=UPI003CF05C60
MTGLPAPVRVYGPFHKLALQVHEPTVQGRNSDALTAAEPALGMTGRDLYDLADRHLYAAKRNGRDRVAAAA